MVYRVLADLTLTLHLAFIVFVVLGGLLALRWRRVIGVHVPAAVWGVLITIVGWSCPLTPIENYFRRLGGQTGYTESFIEHYLISLIYRGDLSRSQFVVLGLLVLAVNLAIYGWIYRSTRRARTRVDSGSGGHR